MELFELPATELARQVREGRVSPTEAVESSLERIERLDPTLNAFAVVRAEKARAEAKELENRGGLAELPLAGVPVAIKDEVDVAGEPTRYGSLGAGEQPAAEDDEVVRRLRAAGCIVVGKTRCPELMIWHFSDSNFGTSRNPWNLERTPGGSSGGSAAAIAAGIVPVAQASDGGGSIRLPAAFCGLFGIKPGPGVVPYPRPYPKPGIDAWFGLAEWGPLATTVADAALVLDVMAGTQKYRDVRPPEGRLRIALSTRAPVVGVRPDREMRLAAERAADAMRGAGHTVVVTDPPYANNLALLYLHRSWAGVADDAETYHLDFERLEPRTQTIVKLGRWMMRKHPVPEGGNAAWVKRATSWFKDFDLLLTPTTARPSVPAGGWLGKGLVGTLMAGTQAVPFTQPWNVAQFPAASVPAGVAADGVPVGVQLVARPGGEALILSVAAQLEQLNPWPRLAPLAAASPAVVAAR